MQIKTILALTDLEEDSLTGLRGAFRIASETGARVVVGHVLVPRTLDPSNVKEFLEKHGFDPSSVTIDIEIDADVHSGIDLLVEESSPDLVVISSKRKRGFMRLLWASVPVGLVGHCKAPVLALHTGKDHFNFKRAVVCVDGSPGSQILVDDAHKLVGADGDLVGLMVIEDSPMVVGGIDIGSYSKEVLDKARVAGEKFVKNLRVKRSDLTLKSDVRVGDAVEEILKTIERHDADLVVVGTGGIGGEARFYVSKVCEQVTRYANVATLVVPTDRPES
ncbi:MAG: universal stress protein [Planctomycetota bacterium]|nr:universal stress protein [Planctomycetota bacterium]